MRISDNAFKKMAEDGTFNEDDVPDEDGSLDAAALTEVMRDLKAVLVRGAGKLHAGGHFGVH